MCLHKHIYTHINTHTHIYVYNVTGIGKMSAKTYTQLSSLWSEIKQHVRGGVKQCKISKIFPYFNTS